MISVSGADRRVNRSTGSAPPLLDVAGVMEYQQPTTASTPPFRRTRQVCAVLVVGLGALTLLGWLTGWRELTSLGLDYIPMAPNSAMAFVALGVGLWLLSRRDRPPWLVWWVRVLAGLVALLAFLRLWEIVPGIHLDTDRWLFPGTTETFHQAPIGKMAYQTAMTLLAASVTLFLLSWPASWQAKNSLAGFLAAVVASIGMIFFLGYLYGAPFFSRESFIPMALNTSLAFLSLGMGLLATVGTDFLPLRQLLGPSISARLLRAFLPFTAGIVCFVTWLMHLVSRTQTPSSAALFSGVFVVGAIFLVSFICMRIARNVGGDLDRAETELREAERQSRSYAAELQALNASLEGRVAERTAALEESRDHLDQFFTITTSLQNPDNVEKTFDLILRFCQRQGYDRAMLSLVDRAAKRIRAVKAVGTLMGIVSVTVRDLEGGDILAVVVREARTAIVPDCLNDSRCDQAAAAVAGIRGMIVVPLISAGDVIGTLQVASLAPLTPSADEIRTLETLGSQAARALAGLLRLKEIHRLNDELEERNQQLQQLAAYLQETVASERKAHEELKKTQGQLVQSEKLAALGQLVAGVAHEINNPLSFVSNNVAVLQRDVQALRELVKLYKEAETVLQEKQPELLVRIRELSERVDLPYTLTNLEGLMVRSRDGLKRIQQIVKDLRDFARLDESDLHEVDVNAGITSTINIIQGQAKKRQVVLELDLSPLPGVTCYPAKINQVVLNLVANAIDACPEGGKVTIATRPKGESVAIAVADTGTGIDPAIRPKIFDPFFTTKPQGKGTGLGLSISYGIIQDHGGTIEVESTLGQGSCFTIRLPRKPPQRERTIVGEPRAEKSSIV